jgi:hypothetical protein
VPFFSGFVPAPAGKVVYGRVTGLAAALDGWLLISDDGGNLIRSGTEATEEFSDQIRVRTRGLLFPPVWFGLTGAGAFSLIDLPPGSYGSCVLLRTQCYLYWQVGQCGQYARDGAS